MNDMIKIFDKEKNTMGFIPNPNYAEDLVEDLK